MTTAVVAPFAGAWIEICNHPPECGTVRVAPFAGAWIEMCDSLTASSASDVAPFAGAWIEMMRMYTRHRCIVWSLPSRERGLKYELGGCVERCCFGAPFAGAWIEMETVLVFPSCQNVAPFAGAWIEIGATSRKFRESCGRSLRGSVD